MNQKERRAEERELEDAVRVLRAVLRSMASRKARRYEQEFLTRVRDMIDREIGSNAEAAQPSAEFVGREVVKQITRP